MTFINLSILRKDTRNLLRKTAESNRNFSLFMAQLCFIAFVGKKHNFGHLDKSLGNLTYVYLS